MAKNLIGTNGEGVKPILQKGSETYLATDSNVSGAGSWGTENDPSDFKIARSPADDDAHKCVRPVKNADGTTVDNPIDPPYTGTDVMLKITTKDRYILGRICQEV